jgi:hypothetical protein
MAYIGVEEGAWDWVGDFVGVMEGDGVRLCVGSGLNVSDDLSETLSVEVFLGDGISVLVDDIISVTAPISLLLIGIPSEVMADESQAALRKINAAVRKITLPVLVCRYAINKHVRVSNTDRSIR